MTEQIKSVLLTEGEVIGPYVIESLIGEGGMAQVYKAHLRQDTKRVVALKIAKSSYDNFLLADADSMVTQLSHPHIVRLIYSSVSGKKVCSATDPERGVWYFAMEYMAGGTLRDWLARRGGRLTPYEAVDVVRQIGEALDVFHQTDSVHLDVKPSNIFLRTDPDRSGCCYAVLGDFGIAQHVNDNWREMPLAVLYASPEQFRRVGDKKVEIDSKSDIYSLAVVLYKMLTGHHPYIKKLPATKNREDLFNTVQQAMLNGGEPHPLPAELKEFEPLLKKALAKEPAQRPDTCGEFVKELMKVLEIYPINPKNRPVSRSFSWIMMIGLVVLCLLVGFGSGYAVGRFRPQPAAIAAPEISPTATRTVSPTPTPTPGAQTTALPSARPPSPSPTPPLPTATPLPPTSTLAPTIPLSTITPTPLLPSPSPTTQPSIIPIRQPYHPIDESEITFRWRWGRTCLPLPLPDDQGFEVRGELDGSAPDRGLFNAANNQDKIECEAGEYSVTIEDIWTALDEEIPREGTLYWDVALVTVVSQYRVITSSGVTETLFVHPERVESYDE